MRPLDRISDFVVTDMAQAFASGSFADQVVRLSAPPASLLDMFTRDQASLALLDLTMLERVACSAGHCPGWISSSVDHLAERLGTLPIVNYHLLIEANPLRTDPRLFTTGETRFAEHFFYQEHADSEEALQHLLLITERVLNQLRDSESDLVSIAQRLDEMTSCLVRMTQSMRHLAENDALRAHFARMRPFWFSARPEVKEGPSGLSSSRVALMDIVLTQLEDEYGESLVRREATMDPAFRHAVREAWKGRASNLHAVWLGLPASRRCLLALPMSRVAQALIEWRQAHIRAIHRLVPAALHGAHGTGGEHQVRDLLRRRLRPAQEFLRATKECR